MTSCNHRSPFILSLISLPLCVTMSTWWQSVFCIPTSSCIWCHSFLTSLQVKTFGTKCRHDWTAGCTCQSLESKLNTYIVVKSVALTCGPCCATIKVLMLLVEDLLTANHRTCLWAIYLCPLLCPLGKLILSQASPFQDSPCLSLCTLYQQKLLVWNCLLCYRDCWVFLHCQASAECGPQLETITFWRLEILGLGCNRAEICLGRSILGKLLVSWIPTHSDNKLSQPLPSP